MSTQNEPKDDNIIEEIADTATPDAEAVAAFLEAQKVIPPTPQEETAKRILTEPAVDEEMPQEEDEEDRRIHMSTDTSFWDDAREKRDDMFISVRDVDIPVTDMDKALYLKATLNDVPVRLTVHMENGVEMECRSLSVYEGDLAFDALQEYLKLYPDMSTALWEGIIQQYRVSMQITQVNGRKLDYLTYEFASGSREEHAKDLMTRSNKQLMNTQGALFGLYTRALNVFQHKMSRLQEAAFNKDFWKPVDSD